MKKFNVFFTTAVCYLLCLPVNAMELPEEMRTEMAQHSIATPGILQLIVSMILVIAMIYITGWIYNKLNIINRNKLKQISKSNLDDHQFTVIQSMPLGQQRHLYSIEMNGKILLIGSTPSHINLIKEFDANNKPEQEEIIQRKTETQTHQSIDIDELYKKYKN